MRIVGGQWEGRELTSPSGRVRPTAEEVRADVMDRLAGDLKDARIADLFAGTGALGLEALSRGAKNCDFVENGASALHSLKANVAKLRATKYTRVFKQDALRFASGLEADRYDIAFADPPYGSGQLDRLVEIWKANRFSKLLIAEHAADHRLPGKARRHPYGDSMISIWTAR